MNSNGKVYVKDLVSIIVPTYNHEAFIDETIQSIINQTYKNIEILICDDCSTDNTVDKIKKWSNQDSRVRLLESPQNRGFSHNTNKGFDNVRGEYMALMGGDDIMLPEKIEKQVTFLKANKDFDVVIHWVEAFDSNTGERLYDINKNIIKDPSDWFFGQNWSSAFKGKNSCFPPTAYLARSEYALHSRYDLRLPYKNEVLYAIDNYMNKPNAKWMCLEEILGKYRIHPNNMHTSKKMKDALMEETCVTYGLAIARYPQITKKLKGVLTYFLFRNLLHESLYSKHKDAEYIKKLRKRFYVEAGLLLYSFSWIVFLMEYSKKSFNKRKAAIKTLMTKEMLIKPL